MKKQFVISRLKKIKKYDQRIRTEMRQKLGDQSDGSQDGSDSENNDNENSKHKNYKYIGHQAKILETRKRIEDNKELPSRFFEEAKSIGRKIQNEKKEEGE